LTEELPLSSVFGYLKRGLSLRLPSDPRVNAMDRRTNTYSRDRGRLQFGHLMQEGNCDETLTEAFESTENRALNGHQHAHVTALVEYSRGTTAFEDRQTLFLYARDDRAVDGSENHGFLGLGRCCSSSRSTFTHESKSKSRIASLICCPTWRRPLILHIVELFGWKADASM